MVRILAVLLVAVGMFAATPQGAAERTPDAEIRRVLEDQVKAWNAGDVRAFMAGYADSAETTFVGSAVTKGHSQVLANYLKRYPTKERMGTLAFTGLEITMLGSGDTAEYASVLGHWHLKRTAEAGGDTGGIFTLLFRRTAAGWKIILDHTS